MGTVRHLYYYPVKGLSPQPLDQVALVPGQGFPFDRMFGIAHADSGFDPANPVPLPKDRFFMLRRDERLAELRTRYYPDSGRFTIHAAGKLVLECELLSAAGQAQAVDFFARLFECGPGQRPILAHAAPHRFTDVAVNSPRLMNAISLINLNSVEEFAARIGKPVDPLRFRANVYLDGWPPFSELEQLEKEMQIGEVRLRILRRTKRCAATEVNPATAQRDLQTVRLLLQQYRHADMGVYAEVLNGGTIAPGSEVTFPA